MSKTTFFKRVALTAIASLGFGMISVAPSNAVAGTPTLTVTAGSASITAGANNETTTAAKVTVTGLLSQQYDSYSVRMTPKTVPTAGTTAFYMATMETSTYGNTQVGTSATGAAIAYNLYVNSGLKAANEYDSGTAAATTRWISTGNSNGSYVSATFGLMLDSHTTRTAADHVGTYVYTVIVTPYSVVGGAGTPVTADLTFTINNTAAAVAAASGTIDPSKTTAILNSGTSVNQVSDSDVAVVATASNDTRATIRVRTYTSTSLQAPESVTITITGPGLVGTSAGVFGKSITTAADGDDTFLIRSDGTAGVASIVVRTTSVTFPTKSVTFYASAAKTITLEAYQPVVAIGSTSDVVRATITDADGNIWGGTAYIYASTAADALIAASATPAACTWDSTISKHKCPVAGNLKGTASLKVIDASTVATANVTSDAVSVRVSTGVATTATISFDKATYAPGDKAQLRVSILDAEGLAMPAGTTTAAFAAALSSNVAFGAGSDGLSGSANITLSGSTSAAANTNAGHQTFVVYMPMKAGDVTVSATGSTGLAAAGRVAVSGTAKVVAESDPEVVAAKTAADAASDAALEAIDAANAATDAANLAAEAADSATVAAEEARDAADAATAAVEALATEVASLIAGLKAQITTLAKTVAKIAKKVKA